jgi:hypothetical protein
VTAIVGLVVSVAGNVGHVEPLVDEPVTLTDRLTAAASPIAAFAGLMIGLQVLKMSRERRLVGESTSGTAIPSELTPGPVRQLRTVPATVNSPDPQLEDAAYIVQTAYANGERVSQRVLAAQLRERGHRFSNAQLRAIATAAREPTDRRAAIARYAVARLPRRECIIECLMTRLNRRRLILDARPGIGVLFARWFDLTGQLSHRPGSVPPALSRLKDDYRASRETTTITSRLQRDRPDTPDKP